MASRKTPRYLAVLKQGARPRDITGFKVNTLLKPDEAEHYATLVWSK